MDTFSEDSVKTELEGAALTLVLSGELAVRLSHLAEQQGLSLERAAIGAIQYYLEQIDGLDAVERSAFEALHEYSTTGMHVTAAEADAWLADLENGRDVEPPECHT